MSFLDDFKRRWQANEQVRVVSDDATCHFERYRLLHEIVIRLAGEQFDTNDFFFFNRHELVELIEAARFVAASEGIEPKPTKRTKTDPAPPTAADSARVMADQNRGIAQAQAEARQG